MEVDEESVLMLNRILDEADNGGFRFGQTGRGTDDARSLKRARRTVEENAELTGIWIERASAKLLSSNRNSQIRLHTLSGSVHAAPLPPTTFELQLRVREPPVDPDERYRAGTDSGREYVIEQMSSRVKGGSGELQDAMQDLKPDDPPNPPAFFALLRQYSHLAAHRSHLFANLTETFSEVVPDGPDSRQDGQTELTFTSQRDRSPVLTFSYRIAPSFSTSPILRSAQPVEPLLSLALTSFPAGLPAKARHALEAISAQFERMLRDQFEAKAAVEAIVKAVFAGGE
ncbi:hypothetical protein Rt10032_c08g3640 [Rhodotorula toruloides]|uniref:Uncharacterized protein n=1 Tax=Rhodotorula toruloides TaxID=5286 RepID=A0A511KGX6_RHOTO|nr:hypothetical protein Rt10032_c08g3640 [Rhodotorula toruloides]